MRFYGDDLLWFRFNLMINWCTLVPFGTLYIHVEVDGSFIPCLIVCLKVEILPDIQYLLTQMGKSPYRDTFRFWHKEISKSLQTFSEYEILCRLQHPFMTNKNITTEISQSILEDVWHINRN
jgi:hypothetical protein